MTSRRSRPSRDALNDAISQLPSLDRAILNMHLEGHTLTDISENVGLSRATVSRRLNRLRAELADLLSPGNPRIQRAYERLAQVIEKTDKP